MKYCGTFSTFFKCYLRPSCRLRTSQDAKTSVVSGCIDQMDFDKEDSNQGIKKTVSSLTSSLTKRFSGLYESAFQASFLSTVQQVQAKTDIMIATLLCQPKSCTVQSSTETGRLLEFMGSVADC
ncbi:hypothetical protein CHS0354_019631 [Potamilus streckersoni]|uniref:Uncharacterized protein n=1 Tax=Potamilus streckersoni TaxID=2493646 RepID=A0AAE0W9E1_9BIVA|nr:hypothetical protein CHS0354_019631 [Potamilus streckersoni]